VRHSVGQCRIEEGWVRPTDDVSRCGGQPAAAPPSARGSEPASRSPGRTRIR
jgi:hypothetical protein